MDEERVKVIAAGDEEIEVMRASATAYFAKMVEDYRRTTGGSDYNAILLSTATRSNRFMHHMKTDENAKAFIDEWAWAAIVVICRTHTTQCVFYGPVRFAFYLSNKNVLEGVTYLVQLIEQVSKKTTEECMRLAIRYANEGDVALPPLKDETLIPKGSPLKVTPSRPKRQRR